MPQKYHRSLLRVFVVRRTVPPTERHERESRQPIQCRGAVSDDVETSQGILNLGHHVECIGS